MNNLLKKEDEKSLSQIISNLNIEQSNFLNIDGKDDLFLDKRLLKSFK